MQKFLAKCALCKLKKDDFICGLSDFEDKSCQFVKQHLEEEGISFCDAFERVEDKKHTSTKEMMEYALDLMELSKYSNRAVDIQFYINPKGIDDARIHAFIWESECTISGSFTLYSFFSKEKNDKQVELIKEEMRNG